MAIYYCHWCDRYVDDDYFPCEELDGELVCPRCIEEKETQVTDKIGENHGERITNDRV